MENGDKVYKFKVSFKHIKSVNREIEVKGEASLETFAKVILESFGFVLDHAFGFYSNLKNMYDSNERYTLFCDQNMPENVDSPWTLGFEKGVKNSHICEAFSQNKTMLFYFDYGDSWEFIVECLGFIKAETGVTYPRVTKIKGQAPKQYQYGSDSDEFDDEE